MANSRHRYMPETVAESTAACPQGRSVFLNCSLKRTVFRPVSSLFPLTEAPSVQSVGSFIDFGFQLHCSGLGWPVEFQHLKVFSNPRFVVKDFGR